MTTLTELKEKANEEVTLDPKYVTVLYAEYGKRKTITACRMVNERGLLLTTDDSWKTLLKSQHKEVYDKVKIVKLDGLSQIEYINKDSFDTIIWDTISQSVEHYLDILYDESNWGGKYREKIQTTNKELKGLEILSPMDYRVTRDMFRPALNQLFNKQSAHIIFTSQMRIPVPGLSPDSMHRPDIPAGTFKIIATRADIIANLRPVGKRFIADVTENSMAYLGKSRIEGIQDQMDLDSFVKTYKEFVFK